MFSERVEAFHPGAPMPTKSGALAACTWRFDMRFCKRERARGTVSFIRNRRVRAWGGKRT